MKTNKDLYWILTILSMASYAWIGFHLLYPSHEKNTFVLCVFKYATGFACPSCGTTRSLLLLLDGQLSDALLMNPLGVIAAVLLLTIPPWILTDAVTGKRTLASIFLWTQRKIRSQITISLSLVALVLLNWGWNISKDL